MISYVEKSSIEQHELFGAIYTLSSSSMLIWFKNELSTAVRGNDGRNRFKLTEFLFADIYELQTVGGVNCRIAL